MNRAELGANWLSSGGAYLIVGAVWMCSAVFFFTYGNRLGSRYDSPNDGCLLSFASVILALLGGAIGFIFLPYPWSIVGSCIGSVVVPTLACSFFKIKMKKWKPLD